MLVHASCHNEALVPSVDDCRYYLLRELCYQPLCPCFVLSGMCPCSVLLAMVPVFCVTSHRVRVRVRVPCMLVSVIVSVFVVFVSTIVSVVTLFQPSCPCACSVFRSSCPCPCSVLHDIVSQTVSISVSSFKCSVSNISLIVWNMSDAETDVFCILLTILNNQTHSS
jgi:hypothetical protein